MFLWIQLLIRRTPLGFLQLKHDRLRLLVSIAGILFADTLMFMQLGIMAGLYDSNTMFHKHLNADVLIMSTRAQQLINMSTFPRRRVFQARDVAGVEDAQSSYLSFSQWRNPETKEKTYMLIIGVNPLDKSMEMPEVNAQLDKIKLADTYLFDRGTRGNYKNTVEALNHNKQVSTEIDRRSIKLAGLFTVGASFAVDGAVITSDQNFLRLFPKRTPGQVSLGLVRVKPGYDPEAVAKQLNKQLPADVHAVTKEGFVNFEHGYLDAASPISLVFGMGTVIGFIIGTALVYQVLSTDVNDHLSEYATFKAIGYSDFYLYGVLIEEIAVLSTLGFIPAVFAANGLYYVLRTYGSLAVDMPLSRLILIYFLTLLMCGLSAFIASGKLRKADPAEIF